MRLRKTDLSDILRILHWLKATGLDTSCKINFRIGYGFILERLSELSSMVSGPKGPVPAEELQDMITRPFHLYGIEVTPDRDLGNEFQVIITLPDVMRSQS